MLPKANTLEDYRALNKQDPSFIEASKIILQKQNIQMTQNHFAGSGSLPVLIVNDAFVFKFFPPVFASESPTESSALEFLTNNNCAVPKLLAHEDINGWKCVQMSKLKGNNLKDLWPSLNDDQRQSTCKQIGSSLRKIHELSIPNDSYFKNNWDEFLNTQKKNCVARHTSLGLRESLLMQIPDFLNNIHLNCNRISFLHTEVMKDHVFFDEQLKFQGFIDFEPSRLGSPEYDFASVLVFLTDGDSRTLKAFFDGYGFTDISSKENFKLRIMAYVLLHQYSNLKRYLEFMPDANTLYELSEIWWNNNRV